MKFDLDVTDNLLTTTRAVRRRLDLERPVPREILLECLAIALQAPTGGNSQRWRWIVVDDADKRTALAELYRKVARHLLVNSVAEAAAKGDDQTKRVYESAVWLADNLEKVPMFVIPCVEGRPEAGAPSVMYASAYASIYPAVWSLQLALRARGLGSTLTTIHLLGEQEAAQILGLPDDILQAGLVPVAYTKGTDFKRAARKPASTVTHWNGWPPNSV